MNRRNLLGMWFGLGGVRLLFALSFFVFGCLSAIALSKDSVPNVSAQKAKPASISKVYLPLILNQTTSLASRSVFAPYFNGTIWAGGAGIFWFGKITSSDNYSDVRVAYNDAEVYIRATIFDRLLWYNTNPLTDPLSNWDAADVYLDLNGNTNNVPDTNAYHFIAQLDWWENPRTDWQAGYRGNGTGWQPTAIPFTTESIWRGNEPNDNTDDNGWIATFHIPFASLGLAGPPPAGTVWGLGMRVYDRDDEAGTSIPIKIWPETLVANRPSTWGRLSFGQPAAYVAPPATPRSTVSIKNGLNGAVVPDGEVGGGTVCGQGLDFWSQWGEHNYAGQQQINIQNQDDVADWPCFSKYYITFPLGSLPSGKIIISSTLTMYQFGNAGQGWNPGPYPSLIQLFTVNEDWNEGTLAWNNAPLAADYVSGSWVDPLASLPSWPGIPRTWDVSSAVAKAYAAGRPLRLALYSPDMPMHSGKYFYSSDADPEGRPVLQVLWGDP